MQGVKVKFRFKLQIIFERKKNGYLSEIKGKFINEHKLTLKLVKFEYFF